MNVLVIGAGEWGRNHIRNYLSIPGTSVTACEKDASRAKAVKEKFGVEVIDDYAASSERFDAVSICTPAAAHEKIAEHFICRGIPVLVEKPLATTYEGAQKLADMAAKHNAVLMVGHTFRFDAGINYLAGEMKKGAFGKIYFVSLARMGFKNPREDCGAIFNYAIHDFDIMCNLFGRRFPDEVSTIMAHSLGRGEFEDFAIVSARFGESLSFSQVSWLPPVKMREVLVVGEKKSALLDPLKFEVEFFEQGIYPTYDTFGKYRLIKHEGKKSSVKVDSKEPLICELEYFLQCAKKGSQPIAGGQLGADIVNICEAAIASGKMKKAVVFDGNGNWK